jgi:FtsH-binding integral membrane protein
MTDFRNQFGMGTPVSMDGLFSMKHLSSTVRGELCKVYAAVGATMLAATMGCAAAVRWGLFFDSPMVPMLMTLGSLMYLSYTSVQGKTPLSQRLGVMMLFGLFQGMSLAPLLYIALEIDASTVVTALLSTASIFVCFSLSALLAPKREYLYLGGFLMSTLSLLFWASFFNMFFQSVAISWMNIYVGLFMFCGFLLYDTQMIILQIELGRRDFVLHAVNLFVDLVAIFVRILVILLDRSEKKKKERR